MKIKLEYVQYIPKQLQPGTLYVAKEFGAVAHLCPCGCGSKIRTPIGPTEWKLIINNNRPTLNPSVGNWQLECKTHYWIFNGEVIWAPQWTDERIEKGRKIENKKRLEYYTLLSSRDHIFFRKLRGVIDKFFNRKI
jgi:hypothetical protein